MKTTQILILGFIFTTAVSVYGQTALDNYLLNYTYESRKKMKISSEQIVHLLQNDEVVLVDIRFKEEQATWQMNYAIKMPLSTVPNRFTELPKDKLIVTACPHKDRAILAMMFLKSKGYKVAYLKDGLLGLAEYLRGDKAKHFIKNFKKQ